MSIPYYNNQQPSGHRTREDVLREQVLQKVVVGLFLATIISAFISQIALPPGLYFLAVAIEFIVIIAGFFAKNEATIEKLYYTFVVATAITLGFFLGYVLQVPGGMEMISTAFATTSVIVGGVYLYTAAKKPDTSGMIKYLFPALLIMFVIYIVGIFVAFSSFTYLLLSIFGAILFSLWLFYDLGRLMNNQYGSPSRMAWMIYWDILLIFKYILSIILMMSRD